MAKKKDKPWDDLQASLLRRLAGHEQTMNQRMRKYYLSEAARLDKEIASFYQKYGGKGNVIQYRNLMQKMNKADRDLLLRDVDSFIKKYPQYANLLPVRQNIYKLNRLEGLQASLRVQQLNIGVYESQQVEQHLKQVGAEAFEEVSRHLGHEYNPEIVKKFVDDLPATNVSANTILNRVKLSDYLSADLAQGMARGDSYKRLADNVTGRFQAVSKNDIARLIYTQGTLVYNEATAGVVEGDFEEYQISTVGDKKVCNICRGLEEKTFRFKDRTVGVNFPPLHPWCRCSFTVVIGDRDKWIDDYVKKHGAERNAALSVLERMT